MAGGLVEIEQALGDEGLIFEHADAVGYIGEAREEAVGAGGARELGSGSSAAPRRLRTVCARTGRGCRRGRRSGSRRGRMVEAAGIEPASQSALHRASTCVVGRLIVAA